MPISFNSFDRDIDPAATAAIDAAIMRNRELVCVYVCVCVGVCLWACVWACVCVDLFY